MRSSRDFHFVKTFEILSFQVDPHGKLRWSALGDLFQEVAWQHADSGDFGQKLFEMGYHWVLSRLQIEVQQLPHWGDIIQLKTASRGIDGLFALREFEMVNSSGEVLAIGISSWLLLDSQSKRPKRPNQFLPEDLFPEVAKGTVLPAKLPLPEETEIAKIFTVQPSDLDMNNHVNNVTYIRWIEDYCLSNNLPFETLEINFLAEAILHQNVQVAAQSFGEGRMLVGAVNNVPIFVARLSV
ncbi:MAG: acyl-ACP thioesterase [Lunatimonas sp.]|uniref:acyl-[acyl-carrier-protein] thioesterase n=1 Tax=Lunatimonas sp. TaxID=2060141 RepID=UPI00263AF1FA|nr:acyl-ACP thioesterase domain-containing protein [Lunatimonas sp.]MCC5939281.1 acyl-ACP thioesterase [Lunatimonas sp.]